MTGTPITESLARNCFERVMSKVDYETLRAEVDQFNAENKWLKRGIAIVGAKGNMGFMESDDINRGLAYVKVLKDGTVQVNHSGAEMGQGINTRMAQVAAHNFDVPMSDVEITETATDIIPNAPPTTMSSTDLCGEAVVEASRKILDVLRKYPGETLAERASNAIDAGEDLSARGTCNAPALWYDFEKQHGEVSYFYVWAQGLSVAEVDLISGSFRVLKTSIVQDTGKSLNPILDVGQVEGGFLYGMGNYMMEEMLYADDGKLISDNVSSYKLPSCGDVPLDWDVELLNYEPDTEEIGLYNSKGVGEANVQLGLSVRFAVLDAVRAARKSAGLDAYCDVGFPASVDRVSAALPSIEQLQRVELNSQR